MSQLKNWSACFRKTNLFQNWPENPSADASLTMSHGFCLSLVFTFLFLLQSLNNDENKFKSTLNTCSTLGRNLTLGNSVFIAKYKELDFLLHPNLFYHRSIECLTNNRNPLEYKSLVCGYNGNFASIQSANEYSLRRKLKRSKCEVNYYPNSCATFHFVLQGDLVFKLNPGPPNNVEKFISSIS